MAGWTHAICNECWEEREGLRIPVRLVTPEPETCCACGALTTSGIYQRAAPDSMEYCMHDD